MRYQHGDIAILAVARRPEEMPYLNHEVIVDTVGPINAGDRFHNPATGAVFSCDVSGDYAVCLDLEDGQGSIVMEWQLRPRGTPIEPLALTRHNEEELVT